MLGQLVSFRTLYLSMRGRLVQNNLKNDVSMLQRFQVTVGDFERGLVLLEWEDKVLWKRITTRDDHARGNAVACKWAGLVPFTRTPCCKLY